MPRMKIAVGGVEMDIWEGGGGASVRRCASSPARPRNTFVNISFPYDERVTIGLNLLGEQQIPARRI